MKKILLLQCFLLFSGTMAFSQKELSESPFKNVSCESAEISAVEDIDTASASNAQKKNAGKNDGEKFQTYQIENVEADAEIIV